MNETDDVIVIEPDMKFVRVYDFLPYTLHRMRRIFKEEYGCDLVNVWQGYKSNRRPGYREIYDLVDEQGEILVKQQPADFYRTILAHENYPLYDEKSMAKGSPKRKSPRERFLEAVDRTGEDEEQGGILK